MIEWLSYLTPTPNSRDPLELFTHIEVALEPLLDSTRLNVSSADDTTQAWLPRSSWTWLNDFRKILKIQTTHHHMLSVAVQYHSTLCAIRTDPGETETDLVSRTTVVNTRPAPQLHVTSTEHLVDLVEDVVKPNAGALTQDNFLFIGQFKCEREAAVIVRKEELAVEAERAYNAAHAHASHQTASSGVSRSVSASASTSGLNDHIFELPTTGSSHSSSKSSTISNSHTNPNDNYNSKTSLSLASSVSSLALAALTSAESTAVVSPESLSLNPVEELFGPGIIHDIG